jgi:excisionase family DNA binding protein
MNIERFGDHDVLLTFEEAAQLLRVSRATMYRLLGSGRLVGHKVGRGWRFYKTDLHRFITSQSSQQDEPLQFAATIERPPRTPVD